MMDTRISLALLAAATTVFLVVGITNVRGKKMLLFNKPFFSSNVHKSEAFKSIKVSEATETITSVAASPAESKTTTNDIQTFTCTSQKGDNTTKGKTTPITLHKTSITTSPKASTSYSLDNIAAVSTGAYSASSPDVTERTTTTDCESKSGFNKKFNNSCYKFVDSTATRSQARSACKDDFSHLVFIETKEENNFLVGETENGKQYWIGIHERPNLFWDNGDQVTFANIDPDNHRTFNSDTGCYKVSNNVERYWRDRGCSFGIGYICECEGAGCPSGYEGGFRGSSYKFVNDATVTMSEARSACKGNSSHLVFIETQEENDFLVGKTKDEKEYWIGIHERPNLFWDNGNQVTFANIDPDKDYTFDDDTGCFKMSDNEGKYWSYRDCEDTLSYICECEGAGCPSGYDREFENSSYKFLNEDTVTMSQARSACKGNSSHLVFIETNDENDFLVGKTQNRKEYWIGIHERPNLFWDNGNQVTFANIDPDHGATFDEDTGCYRMSSNGGRYWRDITCAEQFFYICECEGARCASSYDKQFENSSYKFVHDRTVTMSEARSACKGNSSHLVFIETEEENDFLVEKTEDEKEYWIGIHERPNLFWDNGNQVTFANIDPDHGATFDEDTGCYRMSNNDERYWFDRKCSVQFGYICEYECY